MHRVRATLVSILLASIFPAVSVAQVWTTINNPPPDDVGSILLLRDGSVLAHNESDAGFVTEAWYRLRPVVTADGQLDYVNGVWSTTGSLPTGYQPFFFSSAVLPDGRVILEGGEYCGITDEDHQCDQNTGAIYDPVSETWTSVAPPNGWSHIGDAGSVVLPNGAYMLFDCCDSGSATAQLDAAALQFPDYWQGHALGLVGETGWALMTNDKVLMVESWVQSQCSQSGYEIYDPLAGQWACGQGQVPAQLYQSNTGEIGASIMMYNGYVIQLGADDQMPATGIYNPAMDLWIAGPTPPDSLIQTDGPAAVEPNGSVLALMSPWDSQSSLIHADRALRRFRRRYATGGHEGQCEAVEYAPPSNYASGLGAIQPVAQQPAMCNRDFSADPGHLLVLPSGQIMLTYNSSTVQILTPQNQTPWPNAAPQVMWVSDNYTLSGGNSYSLTGFQLNGLSQGSMYGDDFQNASNYPLVVLQDSMNPGNLVFAATFNDFDPSARPFSRSNSIAPNNFTGTYFTVPAGPCGGQYNLSVITNGISSNLVPVSVTNIQCSN